MIIFHFHTPKYGSVPVNSHFIPRIGEKLRMDIEDSLKDWNGLYEIEDVIYGVSYDKQHHRVDVYGQKIANAPADLSYSAVKQAKMFKKGKRFRATPEEELDHPHR